MRAVLVRFYQSQSRVFIPCIARDEIKNRKKELFIALSLSLSRSLWSILMLQLRLEEGALSRREYWSYTMSELFFPMQIVICCSFVACRSYYICLFSIKRFWIKHFPLWHSTKKLNLKKVWITAGGPQSQFGPIANREELHRPIEKKTSSVSYESSMHKTIFLFAVYTTQNIIKTLSKKLTKVMCLADFPYIFDYEKCLKFTNDVPFSPTDRVISICMG